MVQKEKTKSIAILLRCLLLMDEPRLQCARVKRGELPALT